MLSMDNDLRGMHKKEEGFPWSHVIGYIASLVLTFAALWIILSKPFHPGPLFTITLILAIFQILIQIFFFMHITESHGPRWHTQMLSLGFLFTLAVVAGSIWIMSFGAEAF